MTKYSPDLGFTHQTAYAAVAYCTTLSGATGPILNWPHPGAGTLLPAAP